MTTLTAPPLPRQRDRRLAPVARAAAVSILSAAGVVVVYAVFVRTGAGQAVDQAALDHLADGATGRLEVAAWLRTVSLAWVAALACGCVAIGLARRQPLAAVLAAAVIAGANLTTQALKHAVFERPHLGHEWANSLPSGHTTVVASLVLAALLVVPPAWRWITTLVGAAAVTVTGVGTVVANWHRPSDVVAALLVALAWGAAALAVVSATTPPGVVARAPRRAAALLAGLAIAAALFVEAGVRPDGSTRDWAAHVVIMGGLAVAGAIVVGLFGRMAAVRLR